MSDDYLEYSEMSEDVERFVLEAKRVSDEGIEAYAKGDREDLETKLWEIFDRAVVVLNKYEYQELGSHWAHYFYEFLHDLYAEPSEGQV